MSAISRARERAAQLRQQADRVQQERRSRHGQASDALTSITVDDHGQLVDIEFSAELAEVGPNRWAGSLLTVHRQACEVVRLEPAVPQTEFTAAASPTGPAMPGRPLAPEQEETRRRTERMLERFAQFSTRQSELRITGTSGDLVLTFDGALGLLEARTTAGALAQGAGATARAVHQAWQDAAQHWRSMVDPEAR